MSLTRNLAGGSRGCIGSSRPGVPAGSWRFSVLGDGMFCETMRCAAGRGNLLVYGSFVFAGFDEHSNGLADTYGSAGSNQQSAYGAGKLSLQFHSGLFGLNLSDGLTGCDGVAYFYKPVLKSCLGGVCHYCGHGDDGCHIECPSMVPVQERPRLRATSSKPARTSS